MHNPHGRPSWWCVLLNLKKGNGQGTMLSRVLMAYLRAITHKMAIERFLNIENILKTEVHIGGGLLIKASEIEATALLQTTPSFG